MPPAHRRARVVPAKMAYRLKRGVLVGGGKGDDFLLGFEEEEEEPEGLTISSLLESRESLAGDFGPVDRFDSIAYVLHRFSIG